MEILIIAALIGLIPAAIAEKKGGSFLGWWVFGTLLFIVALPMALLKKPIDQSEAKGMRKCPKCAEAIKAEAQICKHCHSDVEPIVESESNPASKQANNSRPSRDWYIALAVFVILMCVYLASEIGLLPSSSGESAFFTPDYNIHVTGAEGQEFAGSYSVVSASGKTQVKSVEGVIPETFSVEGRVVIARFQKTGEEGLLKAEIKHGDKVVATSQTSDPSGSVSVSTK